MLKRYWKILVALLSIMSISGAGRVGAGGLGMRRGAIDPDTVLSKQSDEPAKLKLKFEPYGLLSTFRPRIRDLTARAEHGRPT